MANEWSPVTRMNSHQAPSHHLTPRRSLSCATALCRLSLHLDRSVAEATWDCREMSERVGRCVQNDLLASVCACAELVGCAMDRPADLLSRSAAVSARGDGRLTRHNGACVTGFASTATAGWAAVSFDLTTFWEAGQSQVHT